MKNQYIIVDSKTFWDVIQNLEGFEMAFENKEYKGYYKGIKVYIENGKH